MIISPELLLSKNFIDNVLCNENFGRRLLSIVFDEAHVLSHWGKGFRKKYGELGTLRALVPKNTSFVALSATLTPRIRADVLSTLRYQKTLIYVDNVAAAADIEQHLEDLLPAALRGRGLIRPYNAAFNQDYRTQVMAQLKAGDVRVLICTNADVDLIVQWKMPGSVSIFVQRAGRGARKRGRTALAVLLVESVMYEYDQIGDVQKAKKPKTYAPLRGSKRGSHAGSSDTILMADEPPLDRTAPNEGLLVFVQTGQCRRNVCVLR